MCKERFSILDRFPLALLMCIAAGVGAAGPAHADLAQNTVTVAAAEEGGTEKCVRVAAPQARSIAVSEVTASLVVGVATPNDGEVLLFPLAADGTVAPGEPSRLTLVKPASLAAFRTIPTAVYAHPRLPLVYVWQDIAPAAGTGTPPPADVVHRDFDHLLICSISGGTLQLVKSTARGETFGFGFDWAMLSSDASDAVPAPGADDRLYLPNLQVPIPETDPKKYAPRIGYVTLDAAGMPVDVDGQLAVKSWADATGHAHIDHPMGLIPYSKTTVFYGDYMVIVSLQLDGPGQGHAVLCEGAHYMRAVGHPTLQRIYVAATPTSYVYCAEHVDGALSMLVQRGAVTGLSAQSYPVIDAKANRLIVGGAAGVHLIALDDRGLITDTQHYLPVGHTVRAVGYSPKFDRIYVPVETLE